MGSINITAFYAGILALILLALSVRVVIVARIKGHVALGTGGKDELLPVIRAQANFSEYVPLALLLMAFNEFSGSSSSLIHILGIALVVARIAHPFGLRLAGDPPLPRLVGFGLTFLVLLTAAVVAILRFFSAG